MKEMTNVRVSFEMIPKGEKPLPNYKHFALMMIFYVKIYFTPKERLVARGVTPPTLTFQAESPKKA
jgi:hypothetical protein